MSMTRSLRATVYGALDPRARSSGLSWVNKLLIVLILLAALLAILETEMVVVSAFGDAILVAEWVLGAVFLAEYLARLWSAPERDLTVSPWRERLRLALSPAGIADLLAIAASFAPLGASSAMLLRFVRLARILRLAKIARFSRAMDHLSGAIAARRDELLLSLCAGLGLMVAAATLLHLVEGHVQPDEFGSIPRALWWAVATTTTIGYGDVYPISAAGKFAAAVVAIFSIGVIAMPTGILAAAFSDAVQRQRTLAEEVKQRAD